MANDISELVATKDGFFIKDTEQRVTVVGGKPLVYKGFLHKEGEKLAKAKQEIRYALRELHDPGNFNGFLIVYASPTIRDMALAEKIIRMDSLGSPDIQGQVAYMGLKYELKE